MPLDPTGYTYYIRPHYQDMEGVKLALPNTQKQTQGCCQNEETKKHGLNERIDQNSRKTAKQNGDKQSIRCRGQNTGYKVAQGNQ